MTDRPDKINSALGSISAPFIRRPIGTSLLAIGTFVIGLVCYSLLGVAALPNVEFPAIFVSASQPGADASTMASTVSSPLERHLGQIAGLDILNSSSSEGRASVFLIFEPGRKLDDTARDVQAAINAAAPDLPAGLTNAPTFIKANPNNAPVLILALTSASRPLSELYQLADSLIAQRVRQLPGVADVDIAGGATPAIRVDLNLRAMAARGLSADEVQQAIGAANVTAPQGFISDGHATMAVATNSALRSAEEFAALVVSVRNGVPTYLRDIATVADGQEDRLQAAWYGSRRAILMLVRKRPDANVVATVDAVKALVPELSGWLPADAELIPFQDRTPTIRASVREVQVTLLISLGLVIMIMLLFLRRLAPTLIAAVSVPLSLAGAFVAMYLFGFTLNVFSLMALVIAISFVVDDAIVVLENIVRHVDAGMPRMEATLLGAREIGFTIVSITASLIAVFLPLLVGDGIVGTLLREFAVTLVAAIALSALVSLTVTPALCGLFLRRHEQATPSRLGQRIDRVHAAMLERYRAALDWTLARPWRMALQPLVMLALTVWLGALVSKGFFPNEDTGQLQATMDAGPGVSFALVARQLEQVVNIIERDPAVQDVGSRVGAGPFGGGASGSMYINLKPLGQGRDESTFDVMRRLGEATRDLAGIKVNLQAVTDFGAGGSAGGSTAQYTYLLKGNDTASLREWTPKLVAALQKLPQLRDVDADDNDGAARQQLVIDRDTAARLNVSIADVNGALYNAFGQRQISTIYSDVSQYKVVLSALPEQSVSPESLLKLYVRSQSGGMVPITALARMQDGVSPKSVSHEDQFPVVSISFNLAPKVSMGDAAQLIEQTLAGLRMPGDIHGAFGGDFLRFQQQQSDTPILLMAALAAVYLILGMLYESLVHPFTILSTLPAAGVGALLALLITGTDLSVVSVIAIVLLIGIVKKNAIMMVDFALAAERSGLSPHDAIREACLVRFRPIMMTSMVAIFSALPLALDFGIGAEMHRPLGIALVGGLLGSQVLTLLSTPAIYLLIARSGAKRRQRRAARRAGAASAVQQGAT